MIAYKTMTAQGQLTLMGFAAEKKLECSCGAKIYRDALIQGKYCPACWCDGNKRIPR